jgi:hypothetical protein
MAGTNIRFDATFEVRCSKVLTSQCHQIPHPRQLDSENLGECGMTVLLERLSGAHVQCHHDRKSCGVQTRITRTFFH